MIMTKYELETEEGEILTFDSQDEMYDYVISRMVESGHLDVIGRDATDELIFELKKDSTHG